MDMSRWLFLPKQRTTFNLILTVASALSQMSWYTSRFMETRGWYNTIGHYPKNDSDCRYSTFSSFHLLFHPVTNILFKTGVVPLTYGILLHNQVSCKYQSEASIPIEASKFTLAVAEVSISLLNHVALVDLQMLQVRFFFFLHFMSQRNP